MKSPKRIIKKTLRRIYRHISIVTCIMSRRDELKIIEKLSEIKTAERSAKESSLILNTDLFVVTSCTNPHDSEYAVNHNPQHSESVRATELLETFSSIRKYYPGALICNIENSSVSYTNKHKIKLYCDQHYDYSSDELVIFSRSSTNKGVPWLVKIIKFLQEEGHRIKSKRIHFIAGRYTLDNPFACQVEDIRVTFRYYDGNDSVSTRYFFFQGATIDSVKSLFLKSLSPTLLGYSVEEIIHLNCSVGLKYVDRVGVRGLVNGKTLIEE
jgi:hypothetical protein